MSDAAVWADPRVSATALVLFAADRYGRVNHGTEFLTLAPAAQRREVQSDCGVPLPDAAVDRLQAARLIICTDEFHTDWHTFELCCRILTAAAAGQRFDPHELATAEDCAWGVTEAALLGAADRPYRPEVLAYVRCALAEAGVRDAPPLFEAAGMPAAAVAPTDLAPDPDADDPAAQQATEMGRAAAEAELQSVVVTRMRLLADEIARLPLRLPGAKERAAAYAANLRKAAAKLQPPDLQTPCNPTDPDQ